jgi:hypothetical protein
MGSNATLVLAGALSLFFAIAIPSAVIAQDSTGLIISFPKNDQILPSQVEAVIEARFEPPMNLEMTPVAARVEAVRPGQRIMIAQGDIRSSESPDRLRAFWDVAHAAPGEYEILVSATAGNRSGHASVRVSVHVAPSVSVAVTSVRDDGPGARVEFSAVASSSDRAAIRRFIWTPGDGSASASTETGVFSHAYPRRDATYVMWLEVNDALGGSALVARDVVLSGNATGKKRKGPSYLAEEQSSPLLQATDDCGCEAMNVLAPSPEHPGVQTTPYCLPQGKLLDRDSNCVTVANPDPPNSCPDRERAFTCSLGKVVPNPRNPNQHTLGWTFEVVAKLSPKTNNPGKCKQGQYNMSTIVHDGQTRNPNKNSLMKPDSGNIKMDGLDIDVVPGGTPYPPFVDPPPPGKKLTFAPDGYDEPGPEKRHLPRGFRWVDQPRSLAGIDSAKDDAEFVTFVTGNLGTCWCRFSIRQGWTSTGGPKGEGLVKRDGKNCGVFEALQ